MSFKKWIVGTPDRKFAKEVAEELDIDPFAALIANSRGIDDLSEFEYFLSNEPLLSSPFDMADISIAADCINEAIDGGLKIAVFGDYDCDGVMATAIMYKYLKSRGADVTVYIPDRIIEGYGMNKSAVEYLSGIGVQLIITVDNGIACISEIEYAASKGIVTVVTDHHLPGQILPDASAVVDPHRTDCQSSFKEICGAQVAFNLVCALENREPEEMLDKFADLLCVAIIGDFMPMVNENRSIVKYGINMIKQNSNTGISTILSVAGIDRLTLDSTKVSFGIVPRINAAGRMGSAMRAFKLITEDNIGTIISIANEIESDNILRQKTEREILTDVMAKIEKNNLSHDRIIVVDGKNYHQGVIGIVAARVCDKYGRPAIVLSSDGNIAHGSGRSITGINIFEAIKSCEKYLERFGGHELAAGVSVTPQNIDNFRKAINDYAMNNGFAVPTINLDFRINPNALSIDMVDAIKQLEPFGNGNSTPVFGIFGVKLEKITAIGQGKHLKLLFTKNDSTFQALLFGVTTDKFCFKIGSVLDIAITLDKNTYKKGLLLSVIIKAIRPNGIDDDKLFADIFAVDDYLSRGIINGKTLLPSRDDIGRVYNYIKKNNASLEEIVYAFVNIIGYARTYIAVLVLKELNLVIEKNKILYILETQKNDLLNSTIYSDILRAGE